MQRFRKIFWAGLAARLLCVPFLMQWFHPDERQMLEFAHFHAHGRLHPFLESRLHLRNQSLPWLFSWVLRFCDGLGLDSPRAYLIGIQLWIAVWTWLGFWALLTYFHEEGKRVGGNDPDRLGRVTWLLGGFFAFFWGFSFLYSRPLLEAVSFAPACFLLLAVRRRQPFRAGLWAGLAAVLRYPSSLWGVGAWALWLWEGRKTLSLTASKAAVLKPPPWKAPALGVLGLLIAVGIGGLADWATYGAFLDSAFSYFAFNRPGGPVSQVFGNDSLEVYWKWFAFLFTPWLAPFFLILSAFGLARAPGLLIFCLPYLLGHLYTPHREPRFMLPLTPIFALAIAQAFLMPLPTVLSHQWPKLKKAAIGVAVLHWILNFIWYPLNTWAQWKSAQGVLLRYYSEIARQAGKATGLITLADPLIDALVPPEVRWGDSQCQWHRPEVAKAPGKLSGELWVLAREGEAVKDCVRMDQDEMTAATASWMKDEPSIMERVFRVRFAHLWVCGSPANSAALQRICPRGLAPSPQGEPLFSDHL